MKYRLFLVVFFLLNSSVSSETYQLSSNAIIDRYFPEVEPLVEELMRRTGDQLEVIRLPSERAIRLMGVNQIDGELLRIESFGDIVPNAVRVDVPIVIQPIYALVHRDSPIQHANDLQGKSMAYSLGLVAHALVAEKYSASISYVDQMDRALKMIGSKRLDYTAVTSNIADVFITSGADVRMLPEPIFELKFYVWLAEKNKHQASVWAAELTVMQEEGLFTP